MAAPRDLKAGIAVEELSDGGVIRGELDGEPALLIRRGNELFAVGGSCTHYHGELAQGLLVGDTIRCPLHHACFSLRTGEALRAPALDPIPCWRVEQSGGRVFAREKLAPTHERMPAANARSAPASVGIIGGGAAGLAAAEMLRREGYSGPITILSSDRSAPYDRPNLSKDYLAGTAPEEWMPLRPESFYSEQKIELALGTNVVSLDAARRRAKLHDGPVREFEAILLATGAEPVKLPIAGAKPSQLHYLRTFADSRALIALSGNVRRAAIVGASFIALEVAASLRARNVAVAVIAPEQQPLERVLGREVGTYIRRLHETNGVTFHLGETVTRVDGRKLTLKGGTPLAADLLVLGVGVRPSIALAEQAGLAIDRGVLVNEYLETSAPGIYAAGDIARWPDPHSGEKLRIEHWVVAQRQGQVAARNILGRREKFDHVPFFWSQHYDTTIRYVGHAETWDAIELDGALDRGDCAIRYLRGGRVRAVATIGRDLESLRAEEQMEREAAR